MACALTSATRWSAKRWERAKTAAMDVAVERRGRIAWLESEMDGVLLVFFYCKLPFEFKVSYFFYRSFDLLSLQCLSCGSGA